MIGESMKKAKSVVIAVIILFFAGVAAFGNDTSEETTVSSAVERDVPVEDESDQQTVVTDTETGRDNSQEENKKEESADIRDNAKEEGATFDYSLVPAYTNRPYVEINGNTPFFTESELTNVSFEKYSSLDQLNRCQVAEASLGADLMPTEERGSIGWIEPTGWHLVKYDGIDGNYLYNRCHLIAYQLAGENANEKNLITGTRYLNTEGMLPFENRVADYIKATNHHVMYRVTPIFVDDELLARGVLMEAESVEDTGNDLMFCVFCYNVQPEVTIYYKDGSSEGAEFTGSSDKIEDGVAESNPSSLSEPAEKQSYVLNTNTHRFHYPYCSSVEDMKDSNKEDFFGTREEAMALGYKPCGNCNP